MTRRCYGRRLAAAALIPPWKGFSLSLIDDGWISEDEYEDDDDICNTKDDQDASLKADYDEDYNEHICDYNDVDDNGRYLIFANANDGNYHDML